MKQRRHKGFCKRHTGYLVARVAERTDGAAAARAALMLKVLRESPRFAQARVWASRRWGTSYEIRSTVRP